MTTAQAQDHARAALSEVRKEAKSLTATILASPALVALTTLVTGGATYGLYWRYLRRIPTAAHLTPTTLRWRRTLVGKCTSVGDADGFRLYHTPGPALLRNLLYPVPGASGASSAQASGHHAGQGRRKKQPTTDETISVRLAGADAPEAGHFGHAAQPFSKEAQDELTRLVLGKTVWCQVAHVDQYGRLVATPFVLRWPFLLGRTNVSLYLVQRGLASMYTQAGAAYGTAGPLARFIRRVFSSDANGKGNKSSSSSSVWDTLLPLSGEARLRRAQEKAKRKRLGMWSQKHVETPEEYKRKLKEAAK